MCNSSNTLVRRVVPRETGHPSSRVYTLRLFWHHSGLSLGRFSIFFFGGAFSTVFVSIFSSFSFCGPFCTMFLRLLHSDESDQTHAKYANVVLKSNKKMSAFTPVNDLFCAKSRQNRRFSLWKCTICGYAWRCPEWILCSKWVCREGFWVDFKCFYALSWRSTWPLNVFVCYFWPFSHRFCAIFDPMWGHIRPFLDHLGTKTGSFWSIFGPIRGHFGDHFGVILIPFWAFWGHFLGPFLDHFGPF